MKKQLLFFILLLQFANAQQKESIFKNNAERKIKAEFPASRLINVEYNFLGPTTFTSKLNGSDYQKGTIKNQKEINVNTNIPIYKTKKWTFTGSLNYKFNEFKIADLQSASNNYNFLQEQYNQFHYFSTVVSATYFSSVLKKPFIYNVSFIADGNDKGYERIKGMIGGSFILKANAATTMTVGGIVFIDPTAQIPFFPTFTYNYKFLKSGYELDFILPKRILLRKKISDLSRLSIGSTLTSTGFYVNQNNPAFPEVSEYSQLEIQSGLLFEKILFENCIISLKGGISNFINSRLTEKGENSNDYFYKNNQKSKGYFGFGISYNPSLKKKTAQ